MTTLRDLTGPWPMTLYSTVGYSGPVTYSLAGNDRFSSCAFAALANFNDLVWAAAGTPMVMSEAEAERFYSVETGFDPGNKATDKGAVLRQVIQHWCANGWPGDVMLKPLGWCDVRPDEIPVAIHMLGGCPAWAMLPSDGAGGYDFSGTTREGDYAHAVFIAQATSNSLTLVTWARREVVSRDWWAKYGREAFGVLHPAWKIPREAVVV